MIEWKFAETNPPVKDGRYLCALVGHDNRYEFMNYNHKGKKWFFNGEENHSPVLWAKMPHFNELINTK